MNIVVLNGSPKGNLSITLTHIEYVFQILQGHTLHFFSIAEKIRSYEEDLSKFQEVLHYVKKADALILACPVYHAVIPGQLKRFIEIIHERKETKAFQGKYVCVLTTSVHYLDNLAIKYLHAVCEDMDMNFAGFYSAGMKDFKKIKERERLIEYFRYFLYAVENRLIFPKQFPKIPDHNFNYQPILGEKKYSLHRKKTSILVDYTSKDSNIYKMAKQFSSYLDGSVEIFNIREIEIKGGCLGCIKCALDNECAYGNSDGYISFYETYVLPYDTIVIAGNMQDRYLSSRWKIFFDRSFFKTHIPVFKDKQMAFLLSGSLSQNPNLVDILSAYPDVEQANLVGIVSDECANSQEIDTLLESLASKLSYFSKTGYIQPSTFVGVGGRKIFRDEIWLELDFLFQQDHQYYKKLGKKNGFIDFPENNIFSKIFRKFIIFLSYFKPIRQKIRNQIKSEMIKPYQKILDQEKSKRSF